MKKGASGKETEKDDISDKTTAEKMKSDEGLIWKGEFGKGEPGPHGQQNGPGRSTRS